MIISLRDTIMTSASPLDNPVRRRRQARGLSQAQLAQAAHISRAAVSAIESSRLVPSVAAALSLARSLDCTVEELFAAGRSLPLAAPQFAWLPRAFPCRYWGADVGGRTLLFPVENGPRGGLVHDGVAHSPDVRGVNRSLAEKTLIVAGCDPAAGLLAAIYRRQGGMRMLVLTRTSGEALELLDRGLIHIAGVHLADERTGNGTALAARQLDHDLSLVHLTRWEEGLAVAPGISARSAAALVRSRLRWVGRPIGAGARRCQDLVRGDRPAPRHTARDHRGVVEAIRCGWADVGVSIRLASEEGQLAFVSVSEEPYDLCYLSSEAGDPRIAALTRAVRSAEYRHLLGDLPGYRPQNLGQIEAVPRSGS
jgi:molybdate-binding protein/DNA-binding XRE family transcriptional regulator